ncbi:MAG: diacylglycerol kinase family lipid kinase [Bacillota bacterium]|nr:diacylglycerol kinase family lipid kinase [Bacillota bacterium]
MNHYDRTLKLRYNTAFIVNAEAGGGKAGRVWQQIEQLLNEAGQRYTVYFTDRPGDGTILAAKSVKKGAELVVAVGGDGSLREVVNGIDLGKIILGILPLGTGNGFRRSTGIPGRWQEALYGLNSWEPQNVDIGSINETFFLNVVGIGFDAAVAEMASHKYRFIKGYMAYLAAFFNELLHFEHFAAELSCDGQILKEDNTLLVVIANGRFYGGALSIAPNASITDGNLDLLLVKGKTNPETTVIAVKALMKKHLTHDGVLSMVGKEITVGADHPVLVHVDGEVIGNLPVRIKVHPKALKLLTPPSI